MRGMRTGNTASSFAQRKVSTYEIHACSLILPLPLLSRKQNGTNRSLSSCFFQNGCPKYPAQDMLMLPSVEFKDQPVPILLQFLTQKLQHRPLPAPPRPRKPLS